MFIKKTICILLSALCISISAFAADNETDLRTMFQNNQAVIYAVNLRSFNADDKNGNGIIDFELGETSGSFINAIERLDELKDLGINTLHLLPVTPSGKIKALGTAGSLYALSDFGSFNLQLADARSSLPVKKQAQIFIEECHKRGIKVIIDMPGCGAYDLFLDRPDLFVLNEDGSGVIPADWMDVRLFNVPDDSSLLKSDIFMLHKRFINNIIKAGADGIRADAASIKPFIFWQELIKYTRSIKPDFLFLAEASEAWTEPVSSKAYFTGYKKLLEAGFDGWYGDCFELKNRETAVKFHFSIINRNRILKKFKEKKSIIGSFATHDEPSPLITGGEAFSKMIIWLNASLPLNPYYVDGFLQGDDYSYEYADKKASETFTDDEYYYTHKGQIDIFNFSRKPQGLNDNLIKEHKAAMKVRGDFKEVIEKGAYIPLNAENSRVFAYQRYLNGNSVIVIINRNLINSEKAEVKIKHINKNSRINLIKNIQPDNFKKNTFKAVMKPGAVSVLTITSEE